MPLDIGVGILLAAGIAEVFGVPLTPVLVVFGIVAALFPDIDIVTAAFGRWRHREITHYPLLYVPVCAAAFFFLPLPYAVLLTLGIAAHFVHDTIGIGWGIAWLWPFSRRKFLLFPEQARRRVLGRVVTWLPGDEVRLRSLQYEGASSTWVRDFYFRPNLLAYVEYGVLLVAGLVLLTYIW